ncbi:CAAX prenyl protease 1 [Diutina catenulata]
MSLFQPFVDRVDSNQWKSILLGITVAKYAFIQYINFRQYKVLQRRTPPAALKGVIDDETYEKTQKYSRAKAKLGFFRRTLSLLVDTGKLYFDVYRTMWSWAGAVLTKWGFASMAPATAGLTLGVAGVSLSTVLIQSALFVVANNAVNFFFKLLVSAFDTFVVEEAYGFNNQTPAVFARLNLTGFVLSNVVSTIAATSLLAIVDYVGSSFTLYATIFFGGFKVFLDTIFGPLILPLFYKKKPLEPGSLRDKISSLASSMNFPMSGVYTIDGSTMTSHSNAFFSGMPWKMEINLFDTLIEQQAEDEIEAIMAHELGHWKLNHISKRSVSDLLWFAFEAKIFEAFVFNEGFYNGLGFPVGIHPVLVGCVLYTFISEALIFKDFAETKVSRIHEYQADKFAKDLNYGESLVRGLIKLDKDNLTTIDGDWLYSSYYNSHPLLLERLSAIEDKPSGDAVKSG